MLAPFVRAKLQRLKVTAVETRYALEFDGAIAIGPRVAWAAGLAEFERVEVYNVVRCESIFLHVLFGAEGSVEIWTNGPHRTQRGDTLRVTAFAWLTGDEIAGHAATLALIGKQNAPIEIRRIKARSVPIDPSFVPIPPREDERRRQVSAPLASTIPASARA